jgi:hypothetical protein
MMNLAALLGLLRWAAMPGSSADRGLVLLVTFSCQLLVVPALLELPVASALLELYPQVDFVMLKTDDDSERLSAPPVVPAHIKIMTAFGYNASAQAGWSSFGKDFNLTNLVVGHQQHDLPGMYRIDCVGCEATAKNEPGFAHGIICDDPAAKRPAGKNPYHFCSRSRGDATDWDDQTKYLLGLAKPHLLSGALVGIFLGDELTSAGLPQGKDGLTFADFEQWVNLVRGLLDELTQARLAAGHAAPILYYCESDYISAWPCESHPSGRPQYRYTFSGAAAFELTNLRAM